MSLFDIKIYNYNCIGWLHSEEFIEERERKREEEKLAIAERRAEKKRLKQLAKNPPQKPKRKRIQKRASVAGAFPPGNLWQRES